MSESEWFRAYQNTISLENVVEQYQLKTGHAPLLIAIPTEYCISIPFVNCQVVRSPSISCILATHLQTEWNEPGAELVEFSCLRQNGNSRVLPSRNAVPTKTSSRAICPHCQQTVKNFNLLGFWYGWERGIEPPYWKALKEFIWKRDGKRCIRCELPVSLTSSECHHVRLKELGGTDSARNLITLCLTCHDYLHSTSYANLLPNDRAFIASN